VTRSKTKTGEDRRVQLCPRALSILKRQLLPRERLKVNGRIDHDHVFFLETGEPILNLRHPAVRWRKTLQSLGLRYRRPYTARQTSVSWHLMTGENAQLALTSARHIPASKKGRVERCSLFLANLFVAQSWLGCRESDGKPLANAGNSVDISWVGHRRRGVFGTPGRGVGVVRRC
jgi:hypothetical protein